jgi:hypothetical protein
VSPQHGEGVTTSIELLRAESNVKSKSSLGLDGQHAQCEYIPVESNLAVGESTSSFGGGGIALECAMWRLQKSLEDKSAAHERQAARKRRMDFTGSRSSTSSIMSSGSNGVQTDTSADFLLLLLDDTSAIIFAASPDDWEALFLMLEPIVSPPNVCCVESIIVITQ